MAFSQTLKISAIGGILALLLASTTLVVFEAWHHARYGHFVGYGLHTDVVVGNSDVGKNDMYYARVLNLSASTIEIEGCRLPGGFAGDGILYHWDVQRFDVAHRQWNSLRGANNWVPQAFGGWVNDVEKQCRAEMTRVNPLSARTLGWVYREWVSRDDAVRMAIHTSINLPADAQRIVYTPIFKIGQSK